MQFHTPMYCVGQCVLIGSLHCYASPGKVEYIGLGQCEFHSDVQSLGNVTGNPWVSQPYLYPYPWKPVPASMGMGWVQVSNLSQLYNYNIKIKYLIYIK